MHYLYRKKSGYRLIHDWAKGGLLEKIGVVKTCVERKKQARRERLSHPAFMPDNAIEAEETGEFHPEDGAPLIRAVSLEETGRVPRLLCSAGRVPRAPDARDLDSAVYLCHITEKSMSDLVEMGFDAMRLMALPATARCPPRWHVARGWPQQLAGFSIARAPTARCGCARNMSSTT
jgi:hypothetical protein